MATRYFTYKRDALAHKLAWQVLRFTEGRGYWLLNVVVPQFTMYDSINLQNVPKDAQAVAGYVNGKWQTYQYLAKMFPKARALSIAVNVWADADCLDVEQGDARPDQAPAWVKRQLARGVKKPVVYCSVSAAPGVLKTLAATGIARSQIRLWTAHYTLKAHRCTSACGFGFTGQADATQYTDKALGRSLDASLCAGLFLPPAV